MTTSEVRPAARELVSLHARFAPLFGRTEACMVPSPELTARFVFDQPAPAGQ